MTGTLGLSILIAGCGGEARKPDPTLRPASPSDTRSTQDDPPLAERELTGMTRNRAIASSPASTVETPVETPRPESLPPAVETPPAMPERNIAQVSRSRPGFRIQLYSFQDRTTAERARQDARRKLEDMRMEVYVEEEAPYYKVRAGDYADRAAAETALSLLKSRKGFSDAWIVKTLIVE
ncbi:MAG: SPOR domain-containing protein [candidate division Zixibacteria bacterium]|nr:SPOR domain-containing protein [candidate division Zixibacteria bacterium]